MESGPHSGAYSEHPFRVGREGQGEVSREKGSKRWEIVRQIKIV